MGLPQELIDHTMNMLHDDLPALKACSFACKAMFASARRLTHQKLCLPVRENLHTLTRAEKSLYEWWNSFDAELIVLSYMTERGLLRHTRQVHISLASYFVQRRAPPPHLHLKSLDRVHTLSIEQYHATVWVKHCDTNFTHFYPTVTSLTLTRSVGPCRLLLQFVLRFPMLQNLCLEGLICVQTEQNLTVPTIPHRSPPFCGHLRLAGFHTVAGWPAASTHELANGTNFRSIELEDFSGEDAQHILKTCARTLRSLTIVPLWTGTDPFPFLSSGAVGLSADPPTTGGREFQRLGFTENAVLRRLTLRIPFPDVLVSPPSPLLSALSTITSPAFCEFVLELPPQVNRLGSNDWDDWKEVDHYFEERFSTHKDFRVIIRTGKFHDQETFQMHTKEIFPLLASRGFIHFETFR